MTQDEERYREQEIIRRVLAGQKDEFRHLVRAHQEAVYSIIRRQVGDEQTARELTQDVMLKAYVNLPKFRFESRY